MKTIVINTANQGDWKFIGNKARDVADGIVMSALCTVLGGQGTTIEVKDVSTDAFRTPMLFTECFPVCDRARKTLISLAEHFGLDAEPVAVIVNGHLAAETVFDGTTLVPFYATRRKYHWVDMATMGSVRKEAERYASEPGFIRFWGRPAYGVCRKVGCWIVYD